MELNDSLPCYGNLPDLRMHQNVEAYIQHLVYTADNIRADALREEHVFGWRDILNDVIN